MVATLTADPNHESEPDEMETTTPRSNTARKKEFDHAGHALVRAHQRARAAPESDRRKEAFARAASRVLAAARDLPDKGRTDRDNQGDPALSARVFGAAYAHQRDPTDRRVQGELLALVAVYYRGRQDSRKERAKTDSENTNPDAKQESARRLRGTGGQREMPEEKRSVRKGPDVKIRLSPKVNLSRNHRR